MWGVFLCTTFYGVLWAHNFFFRFGLVFDGVKGSLPFLGPHAPGLASRLFEVDKKSLCPAARTFDGRDDGI